MKKEKNKTQGDALHKIKGFFHPSSVTWKSRKDTVHDTVAVLGVAAVFALFLGGTDLILGRIAKIVL